MAIQKIRNPSGAFTGGHAIITWGDKNSGGTMDQRQGGLH